MEQHQRPLVRNTIMETAVGSSEALAGITALYVFIYFQLNLRAPTGVCRQRYQLKQRGGRFFIGKACCSSITVPNKFLVKYPKPPPFPPFANTTIISSEAEFFYLGIISRNVQLLKENPAC